MPIIINSQISEKELVKLIPNEFRESQVQVDDIVKTLQEIIKINHEINEAQSKYYFEVVIKKNFDTESNGKNRITFEINMSIEKITRWLESEIIKCKEKFPDNRYASKAINIFFKSLQINNHSFINREYEGDENVKDYYVALWLSKGYLGDYSKDTNYSILREKYERDIITKIIVVGNMINNNEDINIDKLIEIVKNIFL